MTDTILARDAYGGLVVELGDGTVARWIGARLGWRPPPGHVDDALEVLEHPTGETANEADIITRTLPLTTRLKVRTGYR